MNHINRKENPEKKQITRNSKHEMIYEYVKVL